MFSRKKSTLKNYANPNLIQPPLGAEDGDHVIEAGAGTATHDDSLLVGLRWIKPDREYQVLLGNPEFDEIRRISNDLAGFVLAGDSDDVS